MKYKQKRLPTREVALWGVELVGNDKIKIELNYSTESKDSYTSCVQPIEISVCEMRWLGGEFHERLNELEDRLKEARQYMRGSR